MHYYSVLFYFFIFFQRERGSSLQAGQSEHPAQACSTRSVIPNMLCFSIKMFRNKYLFLIFKIVRICQLPFKYQISDKYKNAEYMAVSCQTSYEQVISCEASHWSPVGCDTSYWPVIF